MVLLILLLLLLLLLLRLGESKGQKVQRLERSGSPDCSGVKGSKGTEWDVTDLVWCSGANRGVPSASIAELPPWPPSDSLWVRYRIPSKHSEISKPLTPTSPIGESPCGGDLATQ